jgi:hypothetical protein
MNKEFIPYNLALELKQLGFDNEVIATYPKNRRELKLNNVKVTETTKAILLQQAFRWFRETFGIDSHIKRDYSLREMPKQYCYTIESEDGFEESKNFNTYEEAELDCLRKLIQMVKGGNK